MRLSSLTALQTSVRTFGLACSSTNPEGRNEMRTRFTKLIAGLGVVAAIAVGGATFASAAKKAPPTPPPAAATPAAPAADGDTLQQGDQTAPDTAAAPEQASEAASPESAAEPAGASESSSEVAGNDGPGGHADEPGNANADHQFQGQE